MADNPCTCVADFNVKLAPHNTRIVETLGFPRDGSPAFTRPAITTEKIESRKRGGPAIAVPSFCPFCGTPYQGHGAPASAKPAIGESDRYEEALAAVREAQKPSCSFVQRTLRIGYNEAARYIERMQAAGLVSAPDNCGARRWIGEARP
ncbi:DNA translocase FtsK [Sphingomonas sp.]|uniref:DNA translocase FtsK n=1 Tax=Sphingomonas sp. TaxID=28214 RepID=UPI003F70329B